MSAVDDDDARKPADLALAVRALRYLKPERWWYVAAFLAAPVSSLLSVVQPWLLKKAIDEHIVPGDTQGLAHVALMYLAATLGGFFAEAAYTVFISFGATKTIARLRRDAYTHTLSLSQAFFDKRPTGRLLTRATSDVEALGEVLTAGAITIVLDALVVLSVLIAMFRMDARLTLVMLVLAPPLGMFVDFMRRRLRTAFVEIRSAISALNAFVAERLAGMDVVQLYSDEARSLSAHDKLLGRYLKGNVDSNLWDALQYAIIDGTSAITVALMLWYGSGGLLKGVVTAGLLAAFIDYVGRLFRPIQEFSQKISALQRAAASLEKIFGLLDHREHITPGDVRMPAVKGDIVLDDVRFAYGDGPDVLQGVSFAIKPGEVVAIVGRTGSGKSSIARILTRTYDGYRGRILVDGVELSRIDPGDVRRGIGMVRQDVQLFPEDVRFNLTLGAPIDDAHLRESVHLAAADAAVAKLGGFEGKVMAQGANLSVGEAQLLSFARAMAHDAPVVVLDEATASVDTLTEARIQEATRALFERKTVLVIAHRLSTVTSADRIVVLDAGRVIEQGSHEELLRREGAYAALFRQQFADEGAPSAGAAMDVS